MMPSYSLLIVTFVMFSSLISGQPNVNRLGIRSDSIGQSNRRYPSARSNKTPLSQYGRRDLFRAQQPRPGIKCDGTFYEDAKVEDVASRACREEVWLSRAKPTRNRLSPTYKMPRYDFPAPHLFPHEKNKLTMIRVVNGFFSIQNLRAFLRIGKIDYVVFSEACKTVGVVRQISKNEFVICNAVNGGNAEHTIVV